MERETIHGGHVHMRAIGEEGSSLVPFSLHIESPLGSLRRKEKGRKEGYF